MSPRLQFRLNFPVRVADTQRDSIRRPQLGWPTLLSSRDSDPLKNAEDAFQPTHERAHFFASSVMNAVLAQLQQGLISTQPILQLTGELGDALLAREGAVRVGEQVSILVAQGLVDVHDARSSYRFQPPATAIS